MLYYNKNILKNLQNWRIMKLNVLLNSIIICIEL